MKYLFLTILLAGCTTEPKTSPFVTLKVMQCVAIEKTYSKRQLSKLMFTEGDECSVAYPDVRIRKDRIRAYHTMFSHKYTSEGDGPLEVKEYNIPHCKVYLGPPGEGKAEPIDVAMPCSELDKLLGHPAYDTNGNLKRLKNG